MLSGYSNSIVNNPKFYRVIFGFTGYFNFDWFFASIFFCITDQIGKKTFEKNWVDLNFLNIQIKCDFSLQFVDFLVKLLNHKSANFLQIDCFQVLL